MIHMQINVIYYAFNKILFSCSFTLRQVRWWDQGQSKMLPTPGSLSVWVKGVLQYLQSAMGAYII